MKILVIRFSSLGDVVLSTAIFPNLKAHWPQAEVSVLTRAPYDVLFEGNPAVDHVFLYDPVKQPFSQLIQEIREMGFDIIIDLQGNLKSWYLRFLSGAKRVVAMEKLSWARRWLVWFKRPSESLKKTVRERILDCLKPLEIPVVSAETHLYPSDVARVTEALVAEIPPKLIGIAPGAKHYTKRWAVEGFAEAANRLGAIPDSKIVILGDKPDRAVADKISSLMRVPCQNLAGWTSLKELMAMVSRLSLLLTNDSGLMHMAEALNVSVVAIFGPTVRAFGFAPYRPTSRVVEVVNLPCRPCTLHGDERCPLKHHKCMEDIEVDAVLYATSSLFGDA